MPRGHWSGDLSAPNCGTTFDFLEAGRRYRVVREFVDYDGDAHPEGESWIFRGGFPEVAVDRVSEGTVRFTQRPFGYAAAEPPGGGEARWAVPLIVGHRAPAQADGAGDSQEVRFLLDGDSVEADLPAAEWPSLVANFGAHGFYRARYEPELLSAKFSIDELYVIG